MADEKSDATQGADTTDPVIEELEAEAPAEPDAEAAVEGEAGDEIDQFDDHVDHHEEHYDDHEERHTSLSSRILTWLVLLIAGAALALWGGPKLAPQLPQWAAPAAKFLTPGGDAATREVAALRSEVSARLDAVPTGPSPEDIAGIVAEGTSAIKAETEARIADLEARLSATDATGMDARLSTLESQVEGLTAELGTLTASVQSAVEQGGALSEETLAEIASKSAEVDGIRAQIGEISSQVSDLTQRVENAETDAKNRLIEAETAAEQARVDAEQLTANAEREAALDELLSRVRTGDPFAAELDRFAQAADIQVPAVLLDNAAGGVASMATLKTQFTELSHKAIRASIKAEAAESGNGASRFGAFLKSQVASRSLNAVDGDGTDAVLSRIDAALGDGDLEIASREAETLSDAARAPLTDWLSSLKTRNEVLETISALSAQPS